jgi:hypothetical protein
MVARSASVAANPILDVLAPFAGVGGIGLPWNQWSNGGKPDGQFVPDFGPTPASDREADQLGVPASNTTSVLDASVSQDVPHQDWFDLIHLVPRDPVAFGNIITQIDREFEIYSAFRTETKTLSIIVNGVAPGVEFPEITTPTDVPPQTSILGAATSGNSFGVGLGTIELTFVRATQQGLPAFDGSVVFTFVGANSPFLLLSGSRIVLIPFQFEAEFDESLEFATEVIESISGKEQRIALRDNPRQIFDVEYKLEGTDRRRMSALLFDWASKTFGFPLWNEVVFTTADVPVGTTSYPVSDASEVDFRARGLAAIITDSNTFDVINIDSVTTFNVVASDPSVNAYPAGTPLMPVRTAILRGAVPTQQAVVNLETFRAEFEVTDNATGAPAADVSGFSTYNSKVLFDDCNAVEASGMSGERIFRVYRQDNQTGKVSITSAWDNGKRTFFKGFVARTRAELRALKGVFLALKGRQVSFYLPTFADEILPVDTATIGTNTLDIEAIGFPIYAQERAPFNLLRIELTDGTVLIRTVTASIDVDEDTERLTLDGTWPATYSADEFQRIDFYELVRFDSDALRLRYSRIGFATTRMPVKRVFDS